MRVRFERPPPKSKIFGRRDARGRVFFVEEQVAAANEQPRDLGGPQREVGQPHEGTLARVDEVGHLGRDSDLDLDLVDCDGESASRTFTGDPPPSE